eukprot:TRINITY_DN3118_c1_g1_i1.p1 TRINITY_DN3118_c1_g1~~TRINITY_DN3118_c1_g1_i1.p1  ORF type:complete len:1554 (+),score=198.72 TRINITY_DN3118_c1_g1_i1:632-4663(+)
MSPAEAFRARKQALRPAIERVYPDFYHAPAPPTRPSTAAPLAPRPPADLPEQTRRRPLTASVASRDGVGSTPALPDFSQSRSSQQKCPAAPAEQPAPAAAPEPSAGAALKLQRWWRRALPHAAAAWRRWAAAHGIRRPRDARCPPRAPARCPPPAGGLVPSALGTLCGVGVSRGTISRCPLLLDTMRLLSVERAEGPAQAQLRARQLRHSLRFALIEQGLRVLRLLGAAMLRRRYFALLGHLARARLYRATIEGSAAAALAALITSATVGLLPHEMAQTPSPCLSHLWRPLEDGKLPGYAGSTDSGGRSGWGGLLSSGTTAADGFTAGGLTGGLDAMRASPAPPSDPLSTEGSSPSQQQRPSPTPVVSRGHVCSGEAADWTSLPLAIAAGRWKAEKGAVTAALATCAVAVHSCPLALRCGILTSPLVRGTTVPCTPGDPPTPADTECDAKTVAQLRHQGEVRSPGSLSSPCPEWLPWAGAPSRCGKPVLAALLRLIGTEMGSDSARGAGVRAAIAAAAAGSGVLGLLLAARTEEEAAAASLIQRCMLGMHARDAAVGAHSARAARPATSAGAGEGAAPQVDAQRPPQLPHATPKPEASGTLAPEADVGGAPAEEAAPLAAVGSAAPVEPAAAETPAAGAAEDGAAPPQPEAATSRGACCGDAAQARQEQECTPTAGTEAGLGDPAGSSAAAPLGTGEDASPALQADPPRAQQQLSWLEAAGSAAGAALRSIAEGTDPARQADLTRALLPRPRPAAPSPAAEGGAAAPSAEPAPAPEAAEQPLAPAADLSEREAPRPEPETQPARALPEAEQIREKSGGTQPPRQLSWLEAAGSAAGAILLGIAEGAGPARLADLISALLPQSRPAAPSPAAELRPASAQPPPAPEAEPFPRPEELAALPEPGPEPDTEPPTAGPPAAADESPAPDADICSTPEDRAAPPPPAAQAEPEAAGASAPLKSRGPRPTAAAPPRPQRLAWLDEAGSAAGAALLSIAGAADPARQSGLACALLAAPRAGPPSSAGPKHGGTTEEGSLCSRSGHSDRPRSAQRAPSVGTAATSESLPVVFQILEDMQECKSWRSLELLRLAFKRDCPDPAEDSIVNCPVSGAEAAPEQPSGVSGAESIRGSAAASGITGWHASPRRQEASAGGSSRRSVSSQPTPVAIVLMLEQRERSREPLPAPQRSLAGRPPTAAEITAVAAAVAWYVAPDWHERVSAITIQSWIRRQRAVSECRRRRAATWPPKITVEGAGTLDGDYTLSQTRSREGLPTYSHVLSGGVRRVMMSLNGYWICGAEAPAGDGEVLMSTQPHLRRAPHATAGGWGVHSSTAEAPREDSAIRVQATGSS